MGGEQQPIRGVEHFRESLSHRGVGRRRAERFHRHAGFPKPAFWQIDPAMHPVMGSTIAEQCEHEDRATQRLRGRPGRLVQREHLDGDPAIGRGGAVRVSNQLIPVAVTKFAHVLPARLHEMEGVARVDARLRRR